MEPELEVPELSHPDLPRGLPELGYVTLIELLLQGGWGILGIRPEFKSNHHVTSDKGLHLSGMFPQL